MVLLQSVIKIEASHNLLVFFSLTLRANILAYVNLEILF